MKSILIVLILGTACTLQGAYARSARSRPNSIVWREQEDFRHPFGNGEDQDVEERRQIDLGEILLSTCPKETPVNYRALYETTEKCLRKYFNNGRLAEFLFMIVAKQYEKFGTKVCKLWPEVRGCLDYVFDYVESCNNYKVGNTAESVARYVCSSSEDRPEMNLIGDFLASGGLECVNMAKFSSCMSSKRELNSAGADFCTMLEVGKACGEKAFEQCSTPKPWKLISDGLANLKMEVKCDVEQVDEAIVPTTDASGPLVFV